MKLQYNILLEFDTETGEVKIKHDFANLVEALGMLELAKEMIIKSFTFSSPVNDSVNNVNNNLHNGIVDEAGILNNSKMLKSKGVLKTFNLDS